MSRSGDDWYPPRGHPAAAALEAYDAYSHLAGIDCRKIRNRNLRAAIYEQRQAAHALYLSLWADPQLAAARLAWYDQRRAERARDRAAS